jgi:SAM-dependent methyltransferase
VGLVAAARRALVPGLRNSTWAYRQQLEQLVTPTTRWLDLGCGHQLLPTWMEDGTVAAAALIARAPLVIGLDQVPSQLAKHTTIRRRVAADIARLPLRDEVFDLVSANMVLEHVADGARLLSEVSRVTAPGGRFVFHTPNRRFYQIALSTWVPQAIRRRAASVIEGREMDDVFPTHYRINTRPAIEALAASGGWTVEEMRFVNSGLTMTRVPPLALIEIGVTRLLETSALAGGRSNLVVVLRKTGAGGAGG